MGAKLRLGKFLFGKIVPLRDEDKIPLNNLGSGSPDSTKVLHGDGEWKPASSSSNNQYFPSGW